MDGCRSEFPQRWFQRDGLFVADDDDSCCVILIEPRDECECSTQADVHVDQSNIRHAA